MKLAHTMLRVSDPEAVIEFYFLGHPNQTAELELTYNHGEDERYEKGEGFGHIAIHTPDGMELEEAYRKAVESGGEDYRPPEECPGDYAFVKDPEGYEVEILARPS
jgi:lactoylglutathione lyase